MNDTARLLLGLLVLLGVGCSRTSYVPIVSEPRRAAAALDDVELLFDEDPNRPFQKVARIEAYMPDGAEDSLAWMRGEAARHGLDGICQLQCGRLGTVGQGSCAGFGFVYVDNN